LDEEFRKDFCKLWEALILKDSMKTMWFGERLGAGKYSRYLPIIFTGTTIERFLLIFCLLTLINSVRLQFEVRSN